MIIETLAQFHKVLDGCHESIQRQQKENSEMVGFIKATQININKTIEMVKKGEKCSTAPDSLKESKSPKPERFSSNGFDYLKKDCDLEELTRSQSDLFDFLQKQKLGFEPLEGENVFSFAKKVVSALTSQLRNAKGNISRAQTFLETHEVLLFQSEEICEGIQMLIDKIKPTLSSGEKKVRIYSMAERVFLNAVKGLGLEDMQAVQALDWLRANKKVQEKCQTDPSPEPDFSTVI